LKIVNILISAKSALIGSRVLIIFNAFLNAVLRLFAIMFFSPKQLSYLVCGMPSLIPSNLADEGYRITIVTKTPPNALPHIRQAAGAPAACRFYGLSRGFSLG